MGLKAKGIPVAPTGLVILVALKMIWKTKPRALPRDKVGRQKSGVGIQKKERKKNEEERHCMIRYIGSETNSWDQHTLWDDQYASVWIF